MRLAIVIAATTSTIAGRRARAAYLRESPRSAHVIVCTGRDLQHAWDRGLDEVPKDAEWIHFGADWLEPHPGWWKAARADGKRIAAPVLWTPDGQPPAETRDWASSPESSFPTLTWLQLQRYGLPPLTAESDAECVIRTEYAFTAWI